MRSDPRKQIEMRLPACELPSKEAHPCCFWTWEFVRHAVDDKLKNKEWRTQLYMIQRKLFEVESFGEENKYRTWLKIERTLCHRQKKGFYSSSIKI